MLINSVRDGVVVLAPAGEKCLATDTRRAMLTLWALRVDRRLFTRPGRKLDLTILGALL